MLSARLRFPATLAAAVFLQQTIAVAEEFQPDWHRPACGKVCKLVCETKTLTSTCYGCQSKDICLPNPSRPGCAHLAVCTGHCATESCPGCGEKPPKYRFYWRDWFACGCAQSRTVRVLTKYTAEKKICSYHWEVVDAVCCNCVTASSRAGDASSPQSGTAVYKPAPNECQIGDVLPVTESEWVKLAATLEPDPTEVSASALASSSTTATTASADAAGTESSFAKRLQRWLTK
jgi:hypothetical protein